MFTKTLKLSATAVLAASLAACGGGGSSGGGNNSGGTVGGNQSPQEPTVFVPSQAAATATQTAQSCAASTYAPNSAGAWVMGFRGASGSYSAARGVVCQNGTLDSAAQAMAQSVVQGSAMTLAQLRTQWESSYGGEIIDVQHDELGTDAYDCAEAANLKAYSLYAQGRLTDVGAYSTQNQDGTFSCVLVAGTKAGTNGFGQRPVSDISALVHLVTDGNYNNRLSGLRGHIDVNFASNAVADTCAAGGSCLPSYIGDVIGRTFEGGVYYSMGGAVSFAAENVNYTGINRVVLESNETTVAAMDRRNSTVRLDFLVSCGFGDDTCNVTIDYPAAGGVTKQLTLVYKVADRGTQSVAVLPSN